MKGTFRCQIARKYIVAFDQGTTSSRAIVLDHDANVVSIAQREFTQIYPQPGWVEHDPMEIWATQSAVWVEALAQAGIKSEQVAAIGITNQRETTIVWDKNRKTYLQCDCLAKPTNNGNMQSIV